MRHVGRNHQGLSGANQYLLSIQDKLQATRFHCGNLFVYVEMERHKGSFGQGQPGQRNPLSMNHLPYDQRIHLFTGDLVPVVCGHKPRYSNNIMKGIVLAGGTGSRLFPLTKITNKHLLPIYDRPMIYYPLQTLVDAGVQDIMVVTGGRNSGDFLRLLANGKSFGLKHINYTYQEGEGGIAEALGLCQHFADGNKICVVLGDNIIERDIRGAADAFRAQEKGARVLLKKVHDAERFGVAEIKGDRIVNIEEKPKQPKSDYAVTGIYMYDESVFDKIRELKPSNRGELEITDVNNAYIREGTLSFSFLDGWWTDAGTFDSLLRAANLVAKSRPEAAAAAND